MFLVDLLQHIDVVNEDLGRRGIDEVDASIHKKSMRFSFRRTVIPTNNNDEENESRDAPNNIFSPGKEKRDLAAAFRILAATRAPDKEGEHLGAAAIRDDSQASALTTAKRIESRVVELIETIGEIIVNADQAYMSGGRGQAPQIRSDPVFEYFCEKNMLSLFLDIAKEVRAETPLSESSFHGVVWSPLVKAQVLKTTSLLISDVRNHSILYYLLSHNYINEMITCLLPLKQWTDSALRKMMPAYVDLLNQISNQLAGDPQLFPFLIVEDKTKEGSIKFPLFSSALETATSSFAQSESLIYGSCLAVTVNIMQISYKPVQAWLNNAGFEQRRLADHLCQRLLDRYYRIADLTTGPIVDGVRSHAIAAQLSGLRDSLSMIHEVLWSDVRGLDVRLCESLLHRVVTVLLKNLLTTNDKQRPFLVVGEVDLDVIPEQEALAQVSTVFLAYLFSTLAFVPFQRMLAVALLHPNSTPLWSSLQGAKEVNDSEPYILMPALSDIVNGVEERETCPNPFRAEIIRSLSGDYGDWRSIASSCLIQCLLNAQAVDSESLAVLNIVPSIDKGEYHTTSLEQSIVTYLERKPKLSPVISRALEYVGYLGIQMVYKAIMAFTQDGADKEKIEFVLLNSPVWASLLKSRDFFNSQAQKGQNIAGVSDIFLDLVESAIINRYTARYNESGSATYTCLLSQRGCAQNSVDSDILVRRFRGVSSNDVETTRLYVNMAIHYRSLCKVIDRLCFSISRPSINGDSQKEHKAKFSPDLVDKADLLTRTIGGLSNRTTLGVDLDLTGRMTFKFYSAKKGTEPDTPKNLASPEKKLGKIRILSEDVGVFRSTTHLQLVLDPTDMIVVKPMVGKMEENRGTTLCSISLRNVIAAAADGEWLHVAVRHEDVGFLIKNGKQKSVRQRICFLEKWI